MGINDAAIFLARPDISFLETIQELGLDTSLQAVFDAGDSNSYASGQTWSDANGSDDLWFGEDVNAAADDPTFNGVAGGLSSAEYMGFDGGDHFYFKAQPAWMPAFHKDNATFTIAGVGLFKTSGSQIIVGDANLTTEVGFDLRLDESDKLVPSTYNGVALAMRYTPTDVMTLDAPAFFGVSVDEASGGTASILDSDGTQETFDGTYSSPSAAAASYTTRISRRSSNSSLQLVNGSKLFCIAFWSRALTAAELTALRAEIMGRVT